MTETKRKRQRPFIVSSEKAFTALPYWLTERGANSLTYSGQIITVWYSRGSSHKPVGHIIVKHPRFFDRIINAIRKAYGWPEEAPQGADAEGEARCCDQGAVQDPARARETHDGGSDPLPRRVASHRLPYRYSRRLPPQSGAHADQGAQGAHRQDRRSADRQDAAHLETA